MHSPLHADELNNKTRYQFAVLPRFLSLCLSLSFPLLFPFAAFYSKLPHIVIQLLASSVRDRVHTSNFNNNSRVSEEDESSRRPVINTVRRAAHANRADLKKSSAPASRRFNERNLPRQMTRALIKSVKRARINTSAAFHSRKAKGLARDGRNEKYFSQSK